MRTMSPELQRRNGVALLTKSGVMTIRPGSPSATGRPVVFVDDLEHRLVGPDVEALVMPAVGAENADLRHAEQVVDLRPPGPLQLLPLGVRERLGPDEDALDGVAGQVDTLVVGEVGQVQPVARHPHPDRRPERQDQVELDLGRRAGAGAGPDHADAALVGGPGPKLACRMDAERKRHVAQVAVPGAGDRPAAAELEIAVFHVGMGARVKERHAGRPAGAPVFGDLAARRDAELLPEIFDADLAQDFLVDDRDFGPFLRIVEPAGVDTVEPAPVVLRALGVLDGERFSGPLDVRDFAAAISAAGGLVFCTGRSPISPRPRPQPPGSVPACGGCRRDP